MESTEHKFLTPSVRYMCCVHCIGERCPRMGGHALPCATPGCPSQEPFMESYETKDGTHVHMMEEIMGWEESENLLTRKEFLIDRIKELVGQEPPGIRVLLRVISHPDLVTHVREYLENLDPKFRCTKYEPPWNCAREAEANYENIQYGWLGAANGVGFDESWCENCRIKVMGVRATPEADVETEEALKILEEK